jgi:PAS domain S-box-containing protein
MNSVAPPSDVWRMTCDAIEDPIFIHDTKFRILQGNRAYFLAAGVSEEQAIGLPYWQVFPPGDGPTPGCRQATEKAHHCVEEIHVGNHIFISRGHPVVNENSEILYSMHILHDITEQKIAQRKLEAALSAAQAAFETRTRFLANMSHEIRTPINAVLGFSHLCLNLELPARARDYIDKIHSAASSLLGIVNDILDISKIEAGKLEIESISFSMDELLNQMASLFGLKAREKGVELVIGALSCLPDRLLGDPLRLSQVLTNLLSNALKFTEQGEISLTLEPVSIASDAVTLRFEVRDSGLGMTQEQMDKLFTAFSQADTSTTRKYGGTGLGLSISKQLVESMGGELGVESKAGEGSCFNFTLRFDVVSEEATDTPARPLFVGKRILLVDDNDFNRQVGQELIKITGASVDTADDGQQALEAVSARPYDLVLMDIQMPVMDGYTAARLIRDRYPELPIIALTAHAMVEERARVMAVGMNDIISKPILPDMLYSMLTRWLGNTNIPNTTLLTPPPPPSQTENLAMPDTHDGFDLTTALARVNGDHELLDRFLNLFREHNAGCVDEIGAALAHKDMILARRLSHTLKGGAGTIGMTELQASAARLEAALAESALKTGEQKSISEDLNALNAAWTQAMKTLDARLGRRPETRTTQ